MRKLVPFSPNEIGETTQWLNDLAQDGLCVETWGSVFVKLKEGESKDWVYQIDIDDSTGDPNYQRKLELEKQGWKYVQTIGQPDIIFIVHVIGVRSWCGMRSI